MAKKIALVLVGIVVVVALLGLVLPQSADAEDSIVINAPPAAIYPDLASLKAWNEWTEWSSRTDPTWHPQFTGPDAGEGAVSTWSDGKNGAGTQKITHADPQKGVESEIAIMGGSVVIHVALTMQPEGSGTKVTWHDHFDLANSYLFRYFGPLMPKETLKKIVPSLATLKTRAEKRATP